ncbi:hypothetical protein [Nocardia sp. NPDC057440]|uniref:hypothetical protein n=1 Tax=Nocardia sp. NPDC057440 TaxID=3346134 RepID=UPI00366CC388
MLAVVRAAKLIHHHLVETGGLLGLVRPVIADRFDDSFSWKAPLSSLLHRLAYRPCFPRDRGAVWPVLQPEEGVIATCTEAGYYTFATGEAAAERMFADHVPMGELQQLLAAGRGPGDLTIIKGRSLARVDPRLGVGRVGRRYAAALAAGSAAGHRTDEVDAHSRADCLARVQQLADSVLPSATADERRVLSDLTASLARSFQLMNSL